MIRPLAWLSLAFCSGITVSSLTKIPFIFVYLSAAISLLCAALLIRKKPAFDIAILCGCFFLGGVILTNNLLPDARPILESAQMLFNEACVIKGFVDSDPEFRYGKTLFVFKTENVQLNGLEYSCNVGTLVRAKGKLDISYGDQLIVRGNLCRTQDNYGWLQKNYNDYLYRQRIFLVMSVKAGLDLVKSGKSKGSVIKEFALRIKHRVKEIISKTSSPVAAGILDAMILGEQQEVQRVIYNSMVQSGTVHILVVSGFNVGIVGFIIILFLKLIRLPRNIRYFIVVPALIIYCLITGASCPVVRSTVMAVFFILAGLIKREPDIYNSLCLAVVFILVINPLQLFDIGFQLSFSSVFSIAYFYPKLKSFLRLNSFKVSFPLRFLSDGLLVSLSAWIGTAGFIAYYFRMVSPITVLANIFIIPLATLITLCGLCLISIGSFCHPMASLFAADCELLIAVLIRINAVLISIPGAVLRF